MVKKLLFILLLQSFLAGCTSNKPNSLLTPTTKERLASIEYDMQRNEVEKILDHPGKPMFRFMVGEKQYYITMYRPSNQYRNYLFLYENEELLSILNASTALSIWEKHFGKYATSLPNADKFNSIVNDFYHKRERNRHSFNDIESGYREGSVSATLLESGVVFLWIPGLPEVLIGSGLIVNTVVSMTNAIEFSKNNINPIRIESKSYYNHFNIKHEGIHMGCTMNEIVSALGAPLYRHTDSGMDILVYSDDGYVVFGLTDNILHWIAFDYPLKIESGGYNSEAK